MRRTRIPAAVLAAVLAGVLVPTLGALGAQAAPPASAPQPPAVASDSGRPLILLLHGRGMQGSDTASLRSEWSDALGEGIEAVAGEPLLREDDLRLVWYADAVEPGAEVVSEVECTEPRKGRRTEGWARDVGTTLEAVGTFLTLAGRWLGPSERMALDALAGDLLYLGDDRRRCGAGERLADALARAQEDGRPVVLVAFSFGALVAYDHLRTRPDTGAPHVVRWITVGSLLGHPELREVLLAGGAAGGLPPGVGSWVNVHDPRDPLSAPLIGFASGDAGADAIENRRTEADPGGEPHDPARYLADPATARAVLEVWCGAEAGEGGRSTGGGLCAAR